MKDNTPQAMKNNLIEQSTQGVWLWTIKHIPTETIAELPIEDFNEIINYFQGTTQKRKPKVWFRGKTITIKKFHEICKKLQKSTKG